jgi:2-oxoglutarate dehydrogenase E2 component (dihydrolipoamide succinyltransferase)
MAVNIVVPEVGESIVDARVSRWLKKEGDAVAAGEALVELETDKVDVEVAAPQAGVLGKILHQAGADVKIGETLGTIEAGAAGSTAGSTGSTGSKGSAGSKSSESPKSGIAQPTVAATPSARKVAREQDVALSAVKPEGPRVTRADVERSVAKAPATPNPVNPLNPVNPVNPAPPVNPVRSDRSEERIRLSKRRATIARRLVEAQHTAAMLTTFNEVDMSAIMALRERHKESFKKAHGVNLGLSAFFVKAAIAALQEFPRINAEIQGDEMVLKHYYDIGIAVSAAEGLVVPVLRDADRMSFAAVEQGVRAFAKKAGDGTLTLEDLRGGTFSITNGGVFGSLMSTPILNPPQVGILGLHTIKERPIGVAGQIVLRPMMYVALTYDHRLVDGSEAVRFLVRVKELAEDPGGLLLEL